MKLFKLTKYEKNIIFECLNAAAFGPFFLESGMFYEVYGIKQTDIENIILNWPDIDEYSGDVKIAISASLHLLSQRFFHYDEIWDDFISVPQNIVEKIYYKFTRLTNKLSESEKKIVLECLKAVVSEHFFPGGLFHTLLGYNRSDFEKVISAWPDINEQSEQIRNIIYQALFQLSFFPNGFYGNVSEDIWYNYISVPAEAVQDIFYKYSGKKKPAPKKWDGIIRGAFTPKARKLWNRLKAETQIKYLTNTWCSNCVKNTIVTSYEGALNVDGGITIYGYCEECSDRIEINISIEDVENSNKAI